MTKYVYGVGFETLQCANCNICFAITSDFMKRRRDDHEGFYCPNGHSNVYNGKSEEEKLNDRLINVLSENNQLRQESDDSRKKYNRIRDRVKNGVCPCCDRTFQNLMRHIQDKHPEFGGEKSLRVIRKSYGLTQSNLSEEIGIDAAYISSYENKNYLPEYAKDLIDSWLSKQAG